MSNKDKFNLDHVNSKVIQWHHDVGLIEGATDWSPN